MASQRGMGRGQLVGPDQERVTFDQLTAMLINPVFPIYDLPVTIP